MNLLLERRAEIAVRSLHGLDQKRIHQALYELESLNPKEFFRHPKIHKAMSLSAIPLYIYGGAMRLRLVLSIEGDVCKVIDVVDHDRLERLLAGGVQR